MEAVGAAASVVAIATAGAQISIKLFTFSNKIATAPSRIRAIANDASLTSNVLRQLGDLMNKGEEDVAMNIFSDDAIQNTKASAEACREVFHQLEAALQESSRWLRLRKQEPLHTIQLSKREALKWPFLQPVVDDLRIALRDARETLMLILQVTMLAYSTKLAQINHTTKMSESDQSSLVEAVFAVYQEQALSKRRRPDKASISPKINFESPKERRSITSNHSKSDASQLGDLEASYHAQDETASDETETLDILGNSSSVSQGSRSNSSSRAPSENANNREETTEAQQQCVVVEPQVLNSNHRKEQPKTLNKVEDHSRSHDSLADDINVQKSVSVATEAVHASEIRDSHTPKRIVDSQNPPKPSCSVFEACLIAPVIHQESSDRLGIQWVVRRLPLQQKEILKRLRGSRRWIRSDIMKKLAKLSPREATSIHEYMYENSTQMPEPAIIGVDFKRREVLKEADVILTWRTVLVYIEKQVNEGLEAARTAERKIAEGVAADSAATGATTTEEGKKQTMEALAKAREKAEAAAAAKALKEATAAVAEAAAAPALSPSSTSERKIHSIKFRDAIGRKFTFPFHLCMTWAGMEDLIKQSFFHVEVLGPLVADGCYDLVSPQGEIILPQVWEAIIEPGWTITMHMWPLPEMDSVEASRQDSDNNNTKFKEFYAQEDAIVVVPDAPPAEKALSSSEDKIDSSEAADEAETSAKKRRSRKRPFFFWNGTGKGRRGQRPSSITESEVIEESRSQSPPRREIQRRMGGAGRLRQREDDIVEVIDDHSTPRRIRTPQKEDDTIDVKSIVNELLSKYTTLEPSLYLPVDTSDVETQSATEPNTDLDSD